MCLCIVRILLRGFGLIIIDNLRTVKKKTIKTKVFYCSSTEKWARIEYMIWFDLNSVAITMSFSWILSSGRFFWIIRSDPFRKDKCGNVRNDRVQHLWISLMCMSAVGFLIRVRLHLHCYRPTCDPKSKLLNFVTHNCFKYWLIFKFYSTDTINGRFE